LTRHMQRRGTQGYAATTLKHAWLTAVALQLPLAVLLTAVAAAEPPGSPVAKESLVLCSQADELSGNEQRAALARGVHLAEEAIAANSRDAKAHFALFCNLGKQMKVTGLGLSSLVKFHRASHELDATLALAPDDADALAAKGAMLLETPPLFGGDATAAEGLLRRALEIEPDNAAAQQYLAAALSERGANDEAQAGRAVGVARRVRDAH
jgi:tetratricopeptide (TPR) repeat protein